MIYKLSNGHLLDNWISDFNLMCSSRITLGFFGSLHFAGNVIGAMFILRLGDIYGRKPVLLICTFATMIAVFSLYFFRKFILSLYINGCYRNADYFKRNDVLYLLTWIGTSWSMRKLSCNCLLNGINILILMSCNILLFNWFTHLLLNNFCSLSYLLYYCPDNARISTLFICSKALGFS